MRAFMVLALISAPGCWASLIGNQIAAAVYVPNTSTVLQDLGTATVGPGVEFSWFNLSIDLNNTQIDIYDGSPIVTVNLPTDPFAGVRFQDVNGTAGPVYGMSVDPSSTLSGFDTSRLTLSGNSIWVNLQGLTFHPGNSVIIDLQFTPTVPEPATFALCGLGLWLAALKLRQRARRS